MHTSPLMVCVVWVQSHRHYKNREKPGSQLPRFPSVREVKDGTSPDVTVDKVCGCGCEWGVGVSINFHTDTPLLHTSISALTRPSYTPPSLHWHAPLTHLHLCTDTPLLHTSTSALTRPSYTPPSPHWHTPLTHLHLCTDTPLLHTSISTLTHPSYTPPSPHWHAPLTHLHLHTDTPLLHTSTSALTRPSYTPPSPHWHAPLTHLHLRTDTPLLPTGSDFRSHVPRPLSEDLRFSDQGQLQWCECGEFSLSRHSLSTTIPQYQFTYIHTYQVSGVIIILVDHWAGKATSQVHQSTTYTVQKIIYVQVNNKYIQVNKLK